MPAWVLSVSTVLGSNPAQIYCSVRKENLSKDIENHSRMQSRQIAAELDYVFISRLKDQKYHVVAISVYFLCRFYSVWP